MHRSTVRIFCFFVVALVLSLAGGCGDDSSSPPDDPPVLAGIVRDTSGAPVAGASINVRYCFTSDIPELGIDACDGGVARTAAPSAEGKFDLTAHPNPFYGTLKFQFQTTESQMVRASVYDKNDTMIRVVGEGIHPAGGHELQWDGMRDDGEPATDGLYRIRVEFGEGGAAGNQTYDNVMLYRDLPHEFADVTVTTTDAAGRFEIPLDDIPAGSSLAAMDETGESLGTATISNSVIVYAHASADVYAGEPADLGDLTEDVEVEIELPQ